MSDQLLDPPSVTNSTERPRRVGVELEFNGLDAVQAAVLVQDIFRGEIAPLSDHRIKVETPEYGAFVAEIDTAYAHPNAKLLDSEGADSGLVALDRSLSKAVGDVAGGIVPTEIVSPPLPYTALPKLTELLDALRCAGAGGTESSIVTGFGVHLNVEAGSLEADAMCRLLKAYLIWSPKLREQIGVDFTRSLMPYVDPFPRRYVERVLQADYQPDTETLIGDYLADNPTRNRELDLLPLFKHLDEERIIAALNDDRIKARPAYHYRLPNMNLSDTEWSVVTEWNRWVKVERLAADSDALEHAARATLQDLESGPVASLVDKVLKRFM